MSEKEVQDFQGGEGEREGTGRKGASKVELFGRESEGGSTPLLAARSIRCFVLTFCGLVDLGVDGI